MYWNLSKAHWNPCKMTWDEKSIASPSILSRSVPFLGVSHLLLSNYTNKAHTKLDFYAQHPLCIDYTHSKEIMKNLEMNLEVQIFFHWMVSRRGIKIDLHLFYLNTPSFTHYHQAMSLSASLCALLRSLQQCLLIILFSPVASDVVIILLLWLCWVYYCLCQLFHRSSQCNAQCYCYMYLF